MGKRSNWISYEQKRKSIGVKQNIFAIIKGGTDKNFRKQSAEQLCALTDMMVW